MIRNDFKMKQQLNFDWFFTPLFLIAMLLTCDTDPPDRQWLSLKCGKTKQITQHKYAWTVNKYSKLILESFSPADQS